MPSGNLSLLHSRGFTYLGVLLMLAILGTTLASTGIVWHTSQQRERERELLFVGDQIRAAIGHYYMQQPLKEFPEQLGDLLRDPRDVGTTRHLRKLYLDPITGSAEWGLVQDAHGRIVGVYSKSEQHPIKQANFPIDYPGFDAKEKYADWQFVYTPKLRRGHKPIAPIPQATNNPAPTPAGTKP
jgi:type II secretory pathway pseudopilin PulG